MTDPRVGQYVWWWVRQKRGYPARRYGKVQALSSDGKVARVRLETAHVVPIQTIEVKRLIKSF